MELKFDVPDGLADILKEVIDKAVDEYKQSFAWPQRGDTYYYVRCSGEIGEAKFIDCGYDQEMIDFGNFFKTKEEAEFKAEQLKVLHELEELADDDQEWDNNNVHYSLFYDHCDNIIDIDDCCLYHNSPFCFQSKKSAQNAIDTIGKDRLLKYYFVSRRENNGIR